MCIKTIYHNIYGDGSHDMTERVDTCRPGMMCSHPEVRHLQRHIHSTTAHHLSEKETYHRPDLFPPTPRHSTSPSPSRRRDSGVYVNGTKIANIAKKRHSTTTRDRDSEDRHSRERIVLAPPAPEPPSPRASLKRANTVTDYLVIEDQRLPRPISHDARSSPALAGEDLGRHNSTSSTKTHYHRSSRSPQRDAARTGSDRDDREERRRLRAYRRPTVVINDAAEPRTPSATPEPQPLRKELRWEDEVAAKVAAQNDRIARRPKPHVHQDVKGILKNGGAEQAAAEAKTTDKSGAVRELRRAVDRMDLRAEERERRREKARQEDMYWDRLRDRFEEPAERRRRPKPCYPDEGVYRYM